MTDYYFAISRREGLCILHDPITISDQYIIHGLDEGDLYNFCGDKVKWLSIRDLLILTGKSDEIINTLLAKAVFLTPEKLSSKHSFYFLDKNKLIIIKLNKKIETWKDTVKEVWQLIEPLSLITQIQFQHLTKEWKDGDDGEYNPNKDSNSIKRNELELSATKLQSLFVSIRSKKYNALKSKIKKIYPSKLKKIQKKKIIRRMK